MAIQCFTNIVPQSIKLVPASFARNKSKPFNHFKTTKKPSRYRKFNANHNWRYLVLSGEILLIIILINSYFLGLTFFWLRGNTISKVVPCGLVSLTLITPRCPCTTHLAIERPKP